MGNPEEFSAGLMGTNEFENVTENMAVRYPTVLKEIKLLEEALKNFKEDAAHLDALETVLEDIHAEENRQLQPPEMYGEDVTARTGESEKIDNDLPARVKRTLEGATIQLSLLMSDKKGLEEIILQNKRLKHPEMFEKEREN
jgi:hypothetical protein